MLPAEPQRKTCISYSVGFNMYTLNVMPVCVNVVYVTDDELPEGRTPGKRFHNINDLAFFYHLSIRSNNGFRFRFVSVSSVTVRLFIFADVVVQHQTNRHILQARVCQGDSFQAFPHLRRDCLMKSLEGSRILRNASQCSRDKTKLINPEFEGLELWFRVQFHFLQSKSKFGSRGWAQGDRFDTRRST